MNARERFNLALSGDAPDRVPYLDEGIRQDVLDAWVSQGLPKGADINALFQYDAREEVEPNLDPKPAPRRWPRSLSDLEPFCRRLDPADPRRLPQGWKKKVSVWQERDFPILLQVHHGFFLTLGVGDWRRFYEVIYLTKDEPALVQGILKAQGMLAARLAERILSEVKVDAMLFSEPIGGNHGSLISPRMYQDFVLSSYTPLLAVARRFAVPLVIMRTYANAKALLPAMFELGINCLWACERPEGELRYLDLRKEYGRELRLIGGIDSDVLRVDKEAIRREVAQVGELLAQGSYIPLLDGRVRVDVPYAHYVYYRKLLEAVTAPGTH